MRWPPGARFGLSTNGTIVSPVSLAYTMLVVSQQEAKPLRTSPGGDWARRCQRVPVVSARTWHNVSPGPTSFSFGSDQAFRRITGRLPSSCRRTATRTNRAITVQLPHTPRPLRPAARPIQFRRHQEHPPVQSIACARVSCPNWPAEASGTPIVPVQGTPFAPARPLGPTRAVDWLRALPHSQLAAGDMACRARRPGCPVMAG